MIVPSAFLNMPRHGSIQYHPSLLPKHRGPSSINWPIIQGEARTGLTIFWPDDGLDTGPVLLQKEIEITSDDTLGSVYFDKLYPLGIEAMIEAVELVKNGTAPKIPQNEKQATYESWCRREDVGIDWHRPAPEIYNLIRGANPQPGAWTIFGGKKLQIFDAMRMEDSGGEPGEVVSLTDNGFSVAADGGCILVRRVRAEGGDKIGAAEFAATADITIGTRFDTPG
jgi:methionyl-tRNA formyltransferase